MSLTGLLPESQTEFMKLRSIIIHVLASALFCPMVTATAATSELQLHTRTRSAATDSAGTGNVEEKVISWDPRKTAIIVCDMWDQHWCKGATARVAEMAPRMNAVVQEARKRGVFIIHAP